MADPAPLLDGLERMPDGGRAVWRRCPDGTRIRVALWQGDGDRTVLVFPGRTEFIEKYGEVVSMLLARGFSVAAVDWRGQGMADRHPTRRQMGWVRDFADYQQDVAEVLAAVREAGLPAPYAMIGHSMGGAIGLRALLDGLAVKKAIFSAPMWGILVAPHLRLLAAVVAGVGPLVGFGQRLVPSGDARNYVQVQPFEGNLLTTDPARYATMQAHLGAQPDLGLGGPSIRWFAQARRECRRLQAEAPAPHDTLTLLGSREGIVSSEAIRRIMGRWPNGRLVELAGGEHEVLMERDAILETVWQEIDTHLEVPRA